MTPQEKEAFYDAEIAPALLEISERCQSNGLNMFAAVEYDHGEYGATRAYNEGPLGPQMTMIDTAYQSQGNLDSLVIAYARHYKGKEHNSLVLRVLESTGRNLGMSGGI